ncbi:heavy metal translocating P-type ATPase [Aliirhizobium terrae]|uniref:heavy metal translocating P-type ATPase n=1 Tax=Terrirhizobium terrae TaxID=2926709 RepID=UPI0035B5008F
MRALPGVAMEGYRVAFLVTVAAAGLVIGLLGHYFRLSDLPPVAWSLASGVVIAALAAQVIQALRDGKFGLDVVALISMSAALVFGEYLAANVVALMYAGGQWLEDLAQQRARREMSALLRRVARTGMRYRGDTLEEVALGDVHPGDRLLIREGEVLPLDGRIASDVAVLDLSALTGESLPQNLGRGEEALSGSTCVGPAFDLIASRQASESAYATILRLVRSAQDSKAPMSRLADRYAIGFLMLTLATASATWWWSEDTTRVVAVLVVATPCPLILAVPIAFIAGMSRASRIGVLIKGSEALETLAGVRTVVLDKTGTITSGQAKLMGTKARNGVTEQDLLTYAASLDQASAHVTATALIREATDQGLALVPPSNVDETPGSGLEGRVAGRSVIVGSTGFVRERCSVSDGDNMDEMGEAGDLPNTMTVAVGMDGKFAGVLSFADQLRPDAVSVLESLRASGIDRIILASGDHSIVAESMGKAVGADLALGDLSPEAKVKIVRGERHRGPVMMVGDGINDAPALAAADVGVAMGARGSASSSEVASVVLMVDELKALAKAMTIARRSRRIALESAVAGLGLSITAMIVAAFGYLSPVQGALLQEGIDLAVILNALRALR